MKESKKEKKLLSEKAVALRYNSETESAPRVVAKGSGSCANRIRRIADENGIPITRDDELVEFLAKVDLDQEIPSELYKAVAEILSWVYRANDMIKREIES